VFSAVWDVVPVVVQEVLEEVALAALQQVEELVPEAA